MPNWDNLTQKEIAHQAARASGIRGLKATPPHIIERYRRNR
jgi:hypothetical protein